MIGQYSSSVFFAFAVGVTLYSVIGFYTFGAGLHFGLLHGHNLHIAIFQVICTILSVTAMWVIYISKPSDEVPANNALAKIIQPWLPALQAFYPIVFCVSLALTHVIALLITPCDHHPHQLNVYSICDNININGGMTMRLQFEIMFFPVLTFAFLPDTRIEAIVVSWALCVATLSSYCVRYRELDVITSTVAYTLASGLLWFHLVMNDKKFSELLQRLRDTIREKEELVRVQADEMRAILGNLAHDLKTVRAFFHFPWNFLLV